MITAPAPIKENFPNLTPHNIVALAPIETPFSTVVVLYSLFLFIKDLGLTTLVKTHDGPQKHHLLILLLHIQKHYFEFYILFQS